MLKNLNKNSRHISRIIISSLMISFCIYIFGIEPNWIQVNEFEITSSNVKGNIVIAHVSDLHSSSFGDREERMFKILRERKPDLVVITGDLVSKIGNRKVYQQVLASFAAPLGVYFVKGNWEYWHPINDLEKLLKENNIVLLDNKNKCFDNGICLIGFDDAYEGDVDLSLAFFNIPEQSYKIALFHTPGFYDEIADRIDFALAGHSHGSQFQIPFWGPLIKPYGVGSYNEGWAQRGSSKMYVSRGLGTSVLPARFFSRPEITFFRFQHTFQ